MTERGWELADEVVTEQVDDQRRMLSVLSDDGPDRLDGLTSRLLRHLAGGGERGAP